MINFKNESDFNRLWSDALKRCNCQVVSLTGGSISGGFTGQQPGLPDRLVAHRDLLNGICFIEGKGHATQLSEVQFRFLRDVLCACGVPGFVLRLSEDASTASLSVPVPAYDADTKYKKMSVVGEIELPASRSSKDLSEFGVRLRSELLYSARRAGIDGFIASCASSISLPGAEWFGVHDSI